MTRALLEKALDALVEVYYHDSHWPPKQKAAIEALRAELAKPVQQERKPDAYIRKDQLEKAKVSAMLCEVTQEPRADRIAIYTSPVAQQERRPDEVWVDESLGATPMVGYEILRVYSKQERKPMTRAQREQAAKKAVEARTADANLSWRDALIYETEAFHCIKEIP